MTDCGLEIAAAYGVHRSPEWERVEKEHLAKQPRCLVCGLEHYQATQVHHKMPFHICVLLGRPDLEIDERNLYTMCQASGDEHHLLVGHLDSWESYNPDLERAIAVCRGLLKSQILACRSWQDARDNRPQPFREWTNGWKKHIREELDRLMPKEAA